jgi:outer membrane protein OmpA-like peptidoglycan-associated protein
MKQLASVLAIAACLVVAHSLEAQANRVPLSKDSAASTKEPVEGTSKVGKGANDEQNQTDDDGCHKSSSALTLSIDRKSLSIEDGRLVAKMDGPICTLVMRIIRKESPVIEKSFDYAGPELEVRWPPIPRDQIEQIEVRVTAKNNAYQAVLITPWSATIDHEEVKFDTNKAVIRESEVPLLKDSLEKIKEVLLAVERKRLGLVTLFIAGHTDTRGSDGHNMKLSRDRAEAIAAWFQKQGLCTPIAYEGFGETALRKLTKDEVDEPANRRVDYILSVEPPVIKKGASPVWKLTSKGCPPASERAQ